VTPRDVRLRVDLPGRPTDVVVGVGCLARLDAFLAERLPLATRRLYAVDAGVARDDVVERWSSGWRPEPEKMVRVPAGEAAKTRAVHAALEDAILDARLTRDDVVVAVGGGAVLDVAGFAAATARRGVPWVAVPTSVVAQADAAVGGKTSINHPRGKNLLGAFHPPALVVADVTTLRTLPARDRTAGLAEVYKAGVVGDPALLESLDARGGHDDDAWWLDVVARSIAVKAKIVVGDERDLGPRRILNYGHTVGHALETALGHEAMRHGEGVAIGMGVAAEVALGRGWIPAPRIEAQDRVLARLGLPVRIPAGAPLDRLVEAIGDDKKRRSGGSHTLVLPRQGGGLVVAEDVSTSEIQAALVARQERRGPRAGGSPR
jgi:3-dehydroquinate synthase